MCLRTPLRLTLLLLLVAACGAPPDVGTTTRAGSRICPDCYLDCSWAVDGGDVELSGLGVDGVISASLLMDAPDASCGLDVPAEAVTEAGTTWAVDLDLAAGCPSAPSKVVLTVERASDSIEAECKP